MCTRVQYSDAYKTYWVYIFCFVFHHLHDLHWNYLFKFTDVTDLVQGIEIEGEDPEPDHEIEKTEKDREVVIEIVTAIAIVIEIVDQVVNDPKKIIIIHQKKLQLLSKSFRFSIETKCWVWNIAFL